MDVSFPLSSLRSERSGWMKKGVWGFWIVFFFLLKAGRSWCFYEPGGENTQIWSEFKFDLLSSSSESVKRFSLSVWGGGRLKGGGRRQETPWTDVSPDGGREPADLLQEKLWEFHFVSAAQHWPGLRPRPELSAASLSFPSPHSETWHKLNLAFLLRFPFHLSCSSWRRRRRCGVGAAASELMGLCRW